MQKTGPKTPTTMKRYIVISTRGGFPSAFPPKDPLPPMYVGWQQFDDLDDAKRYAAKAAGERNRPHHVVELVGTQLPIYDPEIGWEPYHRDG